MTNAVSIAQSGSNNVTFRNRIINGAMVIDQRNAGASVSLSTGGVYPVDRFFGQSPASNLSAQQVTSNPATGFPSSVKLTVVSAVAPGTSNINDIVYRVEGYNISDLGFGFASAQTITVSFSAYTSVAGTYSLSLGNIGFGSGRWYVTTYTLPANTWTKVSIVVPGDVTGTWNTTNGIGVQLLWSLGIGTTYQTSTLNAWQTGTTLFAANTETAWANNAGAVFYLTGVQLEAGTTASPFEYRQYGTELALCQRYYYQTLITNGNSEPSFYWYSGVSGQAYTAQYRFAVPMRGSPTITTSGTWLTQNITGPTFASDANSYMAIGTSTTAGYTYFISNGSGMAKFSSEL